MRNQTQTRGDEEMTKQERKRDYEKMAMFASSQPEFCHDCGTELDDGDCPVCDPDPSDDTDIFDESWN